LVLAALLWGLATTGTKYALAGFAPVTLLTVELVAATAALWIALLVRGYRPPASWRRVAVLGLLEPAAAYLAETVGLDRTSASNGAVLLGFESVFVVVLAVLFLRERISPAVWAAVALALVGLVALEGGSSLTGLSTATCLCSAARSARPATQSSRAVSTRRRIPLPPRHINSPWRRLPCFPSRSSRGRAATSRHRWRCPRVSGSLPPPSVSSASG
jgi:drug/metabolite transporter (DMT)-like permease